MSADHLAHTCVFFTVNGNPCNIVTAPGAPACNVHRLQIEGTRCPALTKKGSQCLNMPMRGGTYCGPHAIRTTRN